LVGCRIRETWAQDLALTGATETFHHWTVTETYSGHGAIAVGGGFRSNRITASIGQNLFFDLVSGRFVESTTATLTVNVANATANLGALVGAGHPLWRSFSSTTKALDVYGIAVHTGIMKG
jgi:hypothetical protein